MRDAVRRKGQIQIGERFSVSLQRTVRVPDDGGSYPLPPGLGVLPVYRVEDFAARLPRPMRERGGYFVPLWEREALWLNFTAAWWKPNAVKIGVGGINAITGEPWDSGLRADPQNYLVCPDQPWLDGIRTAEGTVRQFVAVGLGAGDTVEEQLTGVAELGGVQIQLFESKPGRFPDEPPPDSQLRLESIAWEGGESIEESSMGLAAGGQIEQKIYPDPYGVQTWEEESGAEAFVHLLTGDQVRAITGEEPPPSPVTPQLYTTLGLPWFSLADEESGDLPASDRLQRVKSVRARDAARGDAGDEAPVVIDPSQIIELGSELGTEVKPGSDEEKKSSRSRGKRR
jgi:hypothetical protein